MVAATISRIEDTHLEMFRVVVDGEPAGTVEWDGRLWVAKPAGTACSWFTTREQAVDRVSSFASHRRERWVRALQRAVMAGVDPLELVGAEDTWVVESASRPGTAYLVTGHEGALCSCTAGKAGDPVCLHRAAVKAQLGLLSIGEPDPDPMAPNPNCCRECSGLGKVWSEWGRDMYSQPCPVCRGAGEVVTA